MRFVRLASVTRAPFPALPPPPPSSGGSNDPPGAHTSFRPPPGTPSEQSGASGGGCALRVRWAAQPMAPAFPAQHQAAPPCPEGGPVIDEEVTTLPRVPVHCSTTGLPVRQVYRRRRLLSNRRRLLSKRRRVNPQPPSVRLQPPSVTVQPPSKEASPPALLPMPMDCGWSALHCGMDPTGSSATQGAQDKTAGEHSGAGCWHRLGHRTVESSAIGPHRSLAEAWKRGGGGGWILPKSRGVQTGRCTRGHPHASTPKYGVPALGGSDVAMAALRALDGVGAWDELELLVLGWGEVGAGLHSDPVLLPARRAQTRGWQEGLSGSKRVVVGVNKCAAHAPPLQGSL